MMCVLTIYGHFNQSIGKRNLEIPNDSRIELLDAQNNAHEVGTIAKRNIAQYRVTHGDDVRDYPASRKATSRWCSKTRASSQSWPSA